MEKDHFIYRTSLFDKQLKSLLTADKKAAVAADRAEKIIHDIAKYGMSALEVKSKLTKHGELRVRNCLKYDLGSGYRLISLKKGNELYFLFAGSHDDCDRWLDNKRGSQVNLEPGKVVFVDSQGEEDAESMSMHEFIDAADEYEEQLSAKLDDKTLRHIFRGICER
ncbi:MAG: hypothetical protein KQH63_17885 [Desulfobulbaceae bacterium]|nr:hypothetical protein [Desulfobulbaceae bacterium]